MSTVKLQETQASIDRLMSDLGARAREASRRLALAPTDLKDAALRTAAANIRADEAAILAANAEDMALAEDKGLSGAMLDRLALTEGRIEAIAAALETIAALPDPVGSTIAEWSRPNGLKIARVRVPLGVIGLIYESRPNVTADASALCLKAGNAAILRGGSESLHSSQAIAAAIRAALKAEGLPEDAVQLVPVRDRAAVGAMLAGLDGAVDVIVPRGGKSLVGRVQEEARVPVFAHLEGVCHVYVDGRADLGMAREIVLNSKMRRTSICGAAETLLVDEAAAATHLGPIVADLIDAGCEVRGDAATQEADPRVLPASEADWPTEYLDAIISVKVVPGVEGAIEHIALYGSQHTDCIVTADPDARELFLREVDSAIVLHNASTQFADGAEFGMGAEIGIATGKFHARGPVGVEQLTSFKYKVLGTGQTRP